MKKKSIKVRDLRKQKCVLSPKKMNRPGPPYSANDCKHLGKLGNDKQLYYSIPNKNGVYRWVKWSTIKNKKWYSLGKGAFVFVNE